MIHKLNSQRVLAIDPTSQGFGFVVLESPTMVVDWGMPVIRLGHQEKTLARIMALIKQYGPNILAIEEPKDSRRCARIQTLLEATSEIKVRGLKIRRFPAKRVKKIFRAFGAQTKYEIAHTIALQLPELTSRLPRFRKPWMSEDRRTSIFDAAALALTYFHSRSIRTKTEALAGSPSFTINSAASSTELSRKLKTVSQEIQKNAN
jgi:Holliday junction resolvasome RuvABC endonuclease subunit